MRALLDGLKGITERARISTDPGDAIALSHDLNAIAGEIGTLGYERRSSYEEFAPLQLACEIARDAVAWQRARTAVISNT